MDCLCCEDGGVGPASDTDFLGSLCHLTTSNGVEAKFPAESNRYLLYVVAGCPFAARPWIVLSFYGLTNVIPVVKCFPASYDKGWFIRAQTPGEHSLVEAFPDADVDKCPSGYHHLSQLYYRALPDFRGAISVPLLWDTVNDTAVSNSSLGLAKMISTQMRSLATRHQDHDLFPTIATTQQEHDELVRMLHTNVTTAVYRMNATTSGSTHDEMVDAYYATLDDLEQRLTRQPFLMGTKFYFCDIVLFTSLVRLDLAYQWRFGLGRKNIRDNYPQLWVYTRRIMTTIPGVCDCVLPRDIMALYFMTPKFVQDGKGRTLPQVPLSWEQGIYREQCNDDESDNERNKN